MAEHSITRLYKKPGCTPAKNAEILGKLRSSSPDLQKLTTELCYHIETTTPLIKKDKELLKWVLQDQFYPENLTEETSLVEDTSNDILIEAGPRFNFSTSNSTNAVSICRNLGLKQVVRVEVSRRYLLEFANKPSADVEKIASLLYDRMTECRYTTDNIPKKSFNEKLIKKENIKEINVMKKGENAIKELDDELGLAFDEADYKYYNNLFKNVLKRNPTNVELFDLAQSNSEHSRHWFFKGRMVIDGVEQEKSLIDMIIDTQKHTNPNNVIKFSDNSR